MPMSVTYTNYNGRIVAENRGGTETLFLPDTHGNVIETRDMNTGAKTSETTYWPYGKIRTESGTRPPFGYIGALGYMRDFIQLLYVRARYLRTDLARWLTTDPLWPYQAAYGYSQNCPTTQTDKSGMMPQALVGGLAGCLVSGGVSAIGSLISGDSPQVATCKAIISCLAGMILGLFASALPWIAKCLAGAVSGIITSLATSLCNGFCNISVNWKCLAITSILGLILGCASAGLGDEKDDLILSLVNGVLESSAGSICSDITVGRPGRFSPSTFQ